MTGDHSGVSQQPPDKIDVTVPHSARIWNYWLGGKDNYAVDRTAGDQVARALPGIATTARASRAFLARVVRYLAARRGSASSSTSAPGCRPRTTPTRSPSGSRRSPGSSTWTTTPGAGARPGAADQHPRGRYGLRRRGPARHRRILAEAARTLDFTQPVALMLIGSSATSRTTTRRARSYAGWWPPCRPAATWRMSDGTDTQRTAVRSSELYNDSGAIPYDMRNPAVFVNFFDGLELVDPGIVPGRTGARTPDRERWPPASPASPGSPASRLTAIRSGRRQAGRW